MTDKKLNLFQKLTEIREKISVKKTGFNAFGKYNYYEIDEIYRQSKKLFLEYSIFTQFSLLFEPTINQYRATLIVIDADSPDDKFCMSIDSPLNVLKGSASQQVGSNNTYQSKYLYMDLLMLDDGKHDPDKTEKHEAKPRPKYQEVTRAQPKPESIKDDFF